MPPLPTPSSPRPAASQCSTSPPKGPSPPRSSPRRRRCPAVGVLGWLLSLPLKLSTELHPGWSEIFGPRGRLLRQRDACLPQVTLCQQFAALFRTVHRGFLGRHLAPATQILCFRREEFASTDSQKRVQPSSFVLLFEECGLAQAHSNQYCRLSPKFRPDTRKSSLIGKDDRPGERGSYPRKRLIL